MVAAGETWVRKNGRNAGQEVYVSEVSESHVYFRFMRRMKTEPRRRVPVNDWLSKEFFLRHYRKIETRSGVVQEQSNPQRSDVASAQPPGKEK